MCAKYFFPPEIKDDLKESGLPEAQILQTLTHAWQYNRCIVPEFTNRERYIALTRLCEIAIVAEFRGDLTQVISTGSVLGFDIDELIHTLFGGGVSEERMSREFYASILFSSEKASGRRGSQLIRRYIDAIAKSPADWFRIRDCDGLSRFYI